MSSDSSPSPAPTRSLIRASLLYMMWACVGAGVAIAQNRPAGFAGQESGLSVWRDFVFGMGTALSPTLWWLAIQALFTYWVFIGASRTRIGIYGLLIFAVGEFIGALGEPVTYVIFRLNTFDPLLAIVQAGMIGLPAMTIVFALLAIKRCASPMRRN